MRTRLIVAAALLVLATPTWADSVPTPPEVSFKDAPTWVPVAGTNDKVLMIQASQRPKYDIFSLDGKYYVYKKDYWFRSDALNGPYTVVETNLVPAELRLVPKESWVVYPTNWGSMGTSSGPGSVYGGSSGPGMTGSASTVTGGRTSATTGTAVGSTSSDAVVTATTATTTDTTQWTPTISFSTTPKWSLVPGSSKVYYMDKTMRPTTYDLYRYDSRYYTYQKNNWYSATSLNGPYTIVATDDVPMAFRTVKKTYWVSYPTGWTYMTPGEYNTKSKVKVETKTTK
jgi:hypothetical protein